VCAPLCLLFIQEQGRTWRKIYMRQQGRARLHTFPIKKRLQGRSPLCCASTIKSAVLRELVNK
jgi:hypothetical protein